MSPEYAPNKAQKERYKKLSESPPNWQRPFPESVAKKMGLSFLYKYGYDYGSTHVHPLANDGLQDFYTITKLEPKPEFPDNSTVFSNSTLVASLIVQEVLNSSDFNWRAVVYSFFESIRKNIGNNKDISFKEDFKKISILFQEDRLCEQSTA